MASNNPALIGSVIERKSTAPSSPVLQRFGARNSGFPAVHHRSKSAFARNREAVRKTDNARPKDVPQLVTSQKVPKVVVDGDWRDQISRENEERVQNMTEEEREREKQEIIERFGSHVGDVLRRARLARKGASFEGVDLLDEGWTNTLLFLMLFP